MSNKAGFKAINGTNKTKKPQDAKRGMKGILIYDLCSDIAWEDDEKQNDAKPVPMHTVNENQNRDVKNTLNKEPISFPYKGPTPYEPKTPTYDYENRIIDDALEVSGISMKPTDGQLAEFIKRIRTLNKNVIWMLMNNRLTKYTAEDNEINIKSLTNILYVIEKILKENVSGYLEVIKMNAQFYQDVFIRNHNKKVNVLCSSIYAILTGQTLLIQENNMINSKKTNDIMVNNVNNNDINNNANNTFTSTLTVNQNGESNKIKANPLLKFQFIKKPADSPAINTKTNTNNTTSTHISSPDDIFNNMQSVSSSTIVPPSTSTTILTEAKKPRQFNFILNKKIDEENTNQLQNNNDLKILEQLGDLNFNQPITNNDNNINARNENENGTEKKKELDMELFAKCYNETSNNLNQIPQPNMIYQNSNQNPISLGYPNPYPIPPMNYPNGQNYPYPQQVYTIPPHSMYGMSQPPYMYNPQYQPQPQYYVAYNQPPQYQDMLHPGNYANPQVLPQTNSSQLENKNQKQSQPDPFGNLLDLMKSK